MQLRAIACLLLACAVAGHERLPPGVNPKQYQQQQQFQHQPPPPPPPQQQYQQQQQQYQQHQPPAPQYQQPPQQQQFQQQPQQQQQFQQPPQQQQYQQVPQQQQQVPQQQQQVPQQQQQVPQQQQQVPQQQQQFQQVPQQQPAHAHGHQHGAALHKPSLSGDAAHIAEHLEVPIDTSGMSEQELQFHYFRMHDSDNNNMLDGQELIKSLFHWHDPDNKEGQQKDATHQHGENKVFTDKELVEMIDPILEQDDKDRDGFIDYTEFMEAQAKTAQQPTS